MVNSEVLVKMEVVGLDELIVCYVCDLIAYFRTCVQILMAVLKCDILSLQRPLKLQMLRTISIYGKQLYDVCELRNSLNEMLLSTTEFAPSFLYDLDASV
jgi:hypothetical protein